MASVVHLTCENCGDVFERRLAEHERNLKKGRRVFCSLKCASVNNIENIPLGKRSSFDVSVYANNCKDKYTTVRFVFQRARRHAKEKGLGFSLTLDELLNVYEKQNGLCTYTGWLLETKTGGWNPKRMTLDKIDPAGEYSSGNIQLLSFSANCAKNSFTHEQMVSFCKNVRDYWNNPKRETFLENARKSVSEKYQYTKDYSLLRYSYNLARRHAHERSQIFSISLESLFGKYILQGGLCPYSGMALSRNSSRKQSCEIGVMSIDRIDPALGYIYENVQLVCLPANFGKSVFSHEQMLDFCEAIRNHWTGC